MTVLPTVPHVADKVRAATADWPTPLHILEGEADKYAAFDAADVALAASGTVTAELALAHTPMVVGYKVGGLTYFLSKFLMTVTYITLINILLDREAVPEFLQSRATPENLALAVGRLFSDTAARAAQVDAMKEFGRLLGEGDETPSRRAARVLLDFVERTLTICASPSAHRRARSGRYRPGAGGRSSGAGLPAFPSTARSSPRCGPGRTAR